MQQNIFLITRFLNWGKSFIITKLFNKQKFYKNKLYNLCNKNFFVQLQSNDDLGEKGYMKIMKEKLDTIEKKSDFIISAFCPTKEPLNNSKKILKELYFSSNIYLIAIKYKWCLHAQLNIEEIKKLYKDIKNLNVITVEEKDANKKIEIVKQKICNNIKGNIW